MDGLQDVVDEAASPVEPGAFRIVEVNVLIRFTLRIVAVEFVNDITPISQAITLVGSFVDLVATLGLFAKVSWQFEASVLGGSYLNLGDVVKTAFDFLFLSVLFGLVEADTSIRDHVSNGVTLDGTKEVVIEVTDDNQCEEVHDGVHHGGVREQHDHVDQLDRNQGKHLGEAHDESFEPGVELVWVVHGVLHEVKALVELVGKRDVQEDCAKEASDRDDGSLGVLGIGVRKLRVGLLLAA